MTTRWLRGYDPTIIDGKMGRLGVATVERLGVVGVAKGGTVGQVDRFYSYNEAKALLERGPGLEFIEDAYENVLVDLTGSGGAHRRGGAEEVAYTEVDPTGGTVAEITTPVKTGTGNATVTSGGIPWRDRSFCLLVIVGGEIGDGIAKYKLCDNYELPADQQTWSREYLFTETTPGPPKTHKIYIEDGDPDGAYIEFSEDVTLEDFVVGDIWTWQTTCVIPLATKVLEAAEALFNWRDPMGRALSTAKVCNILLVALPLDDTEWGNLLDLATKRFDDPVQPVHIIAPTEKWTVAGGLAEIDTWIDAMRTASETLRGVTIPAQGYHPRLSLVAGHELLDTDGAIGPQCRPLAGVASGAAVRTPVHWPIGWPAAVKVAGYGVQPRNSGTDLMDDGRLTELSREGHFIVDYNEPLTGARVFNLDWVMCGLTSDYDSIVNRLTMDRAILWVQQRWAEKIVRSPGVSEKDLALAHPYLAQDLEGFKADGSIVDYSLTLTPDEDAYTNGIVHAELAIIPVASKDQLEIKFFLTVPSA